MATPPAAAAPLCGRLSTAALSTVEASGLLRTLCHVDGKWVAAASGKTEPVRNPATGETLCHVAWAGHEDTVSAIAAAAAAFRTWRVRPIKERSKILRSWFNELTSHRETLATLMTLEQGKPLVEARGEVDYGAAYVELYAEEAKRMYGDIIPSNLPDRRILVTRQPVGVVGVITPWNFPIAMIARKVAPALAAGCTVVVKPSELTPLSALAMAELAARAGVPPGVVNVVMGDAPEIGRAMMESDAVRKLSFTGSTATGRRLMAAAAATVKRLSLELGGNAPFIVFDDADLALAVKGAMACKFRNAGQTCVCANRFLVQDGIYDKFVDALEAEMKRTLVVGNGVVPGVTQGPLINEAAVAKVETHIADAVRLGATIRLGGKRWKSSEATPTSTADDAEEGVPLTGQFFEPTLITNATSDMLSFREEVFGPVAPIFRFSTEEDAVRMANSTEFGLASYLYTGDAARAWRVSEALEAGMVGVNESAISNEAAPFGGVKQSGVGREGSKYGLADYVDMKYTCLGGL